MRLVYKRDWDGAIAELKAALQRLAFAKTLHARLNVETVTASLPTNRDGSGDVHELILNVGGNSTLEVISDHIKEQEEAALLEGDVDLALHRFSSALKLDTHNHRLWSGRAECFLKAEKFDAAAKDANCSTALSLPNIPRSTYHISLYIASRRSHIQVT